MAVQYHSTLSRDEIGKRLRARTEPNTVIIKTHGEKGCRATVWGNRFYLALSPFPDWGLPKSPSFRINTSVFRGKMTPKEDGTTQISGSFGMPPWLSVFWFGLPLIIGAPALFVFFRSDLDRLLIFPFGLLTLVVLGAWSMGAYSFGHLCGGDWEAEVLRFIQTELLN